MKPKLGLILLLFLISSSSTIGGTPTYYTTYESNNGILCHGIHEGDKYFYEVYSGYETFYDNGTFDAGTLDHRNFTIEIIEVDKRSTISTDFPYVYNKIYGGIDFSVTKFGELRYLGSENYFSYLDWTAWRNLYNNITQENLKIISPSLNWTLYRYKATTQSDTIFSLTVFSIENNIQGIGTYNYNKSDGSLISESFRDKMTNFQDKMFSSFWRETRLVSKAKVSEEIQCPEPISETTNSDDSPSFNFVYFLLLIPITRMKKFEKNKYI